ncbi:MAG TPA: ATP-binding cassette domain-containing protein, partial [Leptospiraceae bacterium]|nr:ATP-binding cassette domain-containing protein [Leptospiraceae bacterium]
MNKVIFEKYLNREKSLKINFDLDFENEIIALLGKSGAGKTTILRCIAGLTNPENGFIKIKNETWYDKKKSINLTPQKRDVGFVFQDYALFPNMTVANNLEFALKDKSDFNWYHKIIDIARIESFLHRKPDSLSGGEKQRVAFARAVIRRP